MNNHDDDSVSDARSTTTFAFSETDVADANSDDSSGEDTCRVSTSLEWQSVKSPYTYFLYGWGNTTDGELGLGGIEEQHISQPRPIIFRNSDNIKHIACGEHHSLILMYNGMVFSCGNNDFGQLGRDHSRTKIPEKVNGLDYQNIVNVACGEYHSVAVNEWGQVFSWGSNSHGQLGMSHNLTGTTTDPKIVKTLATKQIVQVACGYRHCLALSNDGTLYAWGSNEYGQLGLGGKADGCRIVSHPDVVKGLMGVPIAFIACGGHHSFAISKNGVVYGWGKNRFGQLGINSQENQLTPCSLKTLRSVRVKYISCGEDFSVFLTEDGGVFTSGAGSYGQLGHGGLGNEVLPRKVIELMGSTVTQICCGRRHTLTLIPSRGRVYAFGLGGAGQLGNKMSKTASTPQVVVGPWLPDNADEKYTVQRIYAGGDQCFVIIAKTQDHIPPDDYRLWWPNTQILEINIGMFEQCTKIPVDEAVDQDLMTYLETVMSSLPCINGSFLESDSVFCDEHFHNVDIKRATECFNLISKIEHPSILDTLLTCISTVTVNNLNFIPGPGEVESLRAYVILPLYHEFLNPKNSDILQIPFGDAVLRCIASVEKWYGSLNVEQFELLVLIYKNVFIDRLKTIERNYLSNWDSSLVTPLEMLKNLNKLNKGDSANKVFAKYGGNKVPYHTFYVSELLENVDIRIDYVKWVLDSPRNRYYFCNYPFIFDAEAKTTLLQTDQSMQMQDAMNSAVQRVITQMFFSNAESGSISQYLEIHVSRDNIVGDTLRELSEHPESDLKKPLRVHFLGEEAEDAGGVRKEFFMLALKDILDPKYGMFQSYEETNTIWFNTDSFEDDAMFFLIGILCGLAIYNFTIINLPFPLAMYKKLLHEPVRLQDMKELSPTVAKSLEDVLNYNEPDLEDVFNLHFAITRDCFGEVKVIPLKPDGETIPVTLENKQEFVDLYVDMILNKMVEARFNQFSAGFHKVCGGRVLKLFHAQELMSVVIGNEDYDWYQLENNAAYKKGYSSSDPTIRMFWEVFHDLTLEDKKKFLLYLTGSDRIPIQGMKAIKIVIQPTADDKYLPVAHTCFNLLDLPRYSTKEKLRYKLLQAIQQTQGFSLV